jgi:hypothetical protein
MGVSRELAACHNVLHKRQVENDVVLSLASTLNSTTSYENHEERRITVMED